MHNSFIVPQIGAESKQLGKGEQVETVYDMPGKKRVSAFLS